MSAWLDRLELEEAKLRWEEAKTATARAEAYEGRKPGRWHIEEAEAAGAYIRLLEARK